MKLVDEIFSKSIFNETKLLEYGFIKTESSFLYNTKIHNNKFELKLSVSNGEASGKLIDLDFNDEYTQINIEGPVGSFIGNLREECEKILIDIRDKCCSVERFISSQANSIQKYIDNKYGIKIEFLWEKYPGFGIFRRKENNKWFGLISEVKRSKLDNGNNNEVINILNVKVEDGMAYSYIDNVGIYKAYHMNANNWISVLLDGSVDAGYDGVVYEIVEMTPTQYFELCSKIQGMKPDEIIDFIGADERQITHIKDVILKYGKKLPLPYVSFSDNTEVSGQEGRHRMYALGEMFG